jgi:DNA polymerase III epsilon subunit-like protein
MILLTDTETTGLLKNHRDWFGQPGICQIGAVKLDDDLKEIGSFNLLVNPEIGKWEPEAIATHGITPDAVKDAPTFFEAGAAFAEFALGCHTWGGFHCKFDKDVLWWQLLRYGLEKNFPWPIREVDVMKRASKIMEVQGKRGTKFPTLGEAYKYCFNRDFDNAHDAVADIRATAEIWRWTTLYIPEGETVNAESKD